MLFLPYSGKRPALSLDSFFFYPVTPNRKGGEGPEGLLVKAADMMIARRADTKARADFATWKMMAKLNGVSTLPDEAQAFLARYQALLKDMPEPKATETTIQLVYRSYYSEMGGTGVPPDVKAQASDPVTGNVTAFR